YDTLGSTRRTYHCRETGATRATRSTLHLPPISFWQLSIYGFMRKVNLRNVDSAIDDPDASTWSHPTLNRHSPPEGMLRNGVKQNGIASLSVIHKFAKESSSHIGDLSNAVIEAYIWEVLGSGSCWYQ
ncbi:MAG: hypothetical protein NXY57DRAFT_1045119, partial [Lentinula lateritia]